MVSGDNNDRKLANVGPPYSLLIPDSSKSPNRQEARYCLSMKISEDEPRLFSSQAHIDERGSLFSLEFPNFPMRRFYYIQSSQKNAKRGFHAHKQLTQIFIPLVGSWKINLQKRESSREYILVAGQNYLQLPPGYWREFESLEEASVLGVLADDIFREEDYIRDFNDFKKWEEINDSVL